MKQDFQILFMVLLATAIAFGVLKYLGIKRKETSSWLMIFGSLAVVAVMTGDLYVVFTGLVMIRIFYTGNDLNRNLAMFLFLLPALPVSGAIMLPTPSIHIIQANYSLLVILVFLVPMLPKLIAESNLMQRKILFSVPIVYIILRDLPFLLSDTVDLTHTSIADVIEQTTTGKIRETTRFFVTYILPYYAMVSWINSDRRLNLAMSAICTSGLIMMIIAFPSGVLGWDYFRTIFAGVTDTFRFRDGMLRLNVNMEHSITLGYYATIFFGAMLAAVSITKFNWFRFGLTVACAGPAIFFTQSKGAMVGALVIVMSFFYFKMQISSRKISSAFLAAMLLIIALPFLLAAKESGSRTERDVDISQVDSFEYRKRLAAAEIELILKKPVFGYPNAYQTPQMEAMRQGEGIIDPVNTYLTLAMEKGLICLAMYLFLIWSGIRGVLRYVHGGFERHKSRRVLVGAALAATLMSMSVQMIFTSFSGMIIVYFWIVSGICMGVAKGFDRDLPKAKETINFGLIKEPL